MLARAVQAMHTVGPGCILLTSLQILSYTLVSQVQMALCMVLILCDGEVTADGHSTGDMMREIEILFMFTPSNMKGKSHLKASQLEIQCTVLILRSWRAERLGRPVCPKSPGLLRKAPVYPGAWVAFRMTCCLSPDRKRLNRTSSCKE